ncbi:hypothetical protein ACHAQH_008163, partial [Verticillium albo-atrum]
MSSTQNSRVVLVTGATSGIGKETAKLLASEGWKVVLLSSKSRPAEGEAIFIPGDLSTEDAVRQLIDQSFEAYGRLDGAVNNATTDGAPFADLSTKEFENMIQVNVMGVFWCMKYQLKKMLPQKSGNIVNLASIAGLNGIRASATRSATKHA